ncbi:MAG: ABC transporter transmembrane domain-containing protein [Gemmatimonadota bacterium]
MTEERLSPGRAYGFLRRLTPRLRPHGKALGWAGVLILLGTVFGLAFPLVVRELLDAAFLEGDARLLNQVALGLLVLFTLQAVVNFGQSYLTASVSERVVAGLRKDLFSHLVHQPPGYFTGRRVGELSSRLASDTGLVQGVLRFGVPELVRQLLFLVGALVLVTITHPRLTLVTFTTIPVAALVGWLLGRRVRRISTRIQDRLAAAVARGEQVFTQIRTVQSFTREGWEEERFNQEVNATQDQGLERAMARASLTGAVTLAAFGAVVLVLWEGGRLVLAGALTPGTLVAFLLYAVTIAGAISSLAGFWGNLQEAAGAARNILDLLDDPLEMEDPSDPLPLPTPLRGRVKYEGVSFRYGPELPLVLHGANVELEPGERVALVGSSGAGKSTLASLLPRFFDPEEGRILLDGVDIRSLSRRDLRSVIGLVPQEPMLFAGTVAENLEYGRAGATLEEMEEAARAAHAHDFIQALPHGYSQAVGERGVTLSAGQRQRLAIARIILKRARILILDEASSSLDAESERLVQDALDRLMVGRTTLVIAHRLSTVLQADRILVLGGGMIQDQGRHDELLERSEIYGRLYRQQFQQALATWGGVEPS